MKWKRGKTLKTRITENWDRDQIAKNDKLEAAVIFSDFNEGDQGRSRRAVCSLNVEHPLYEENARLIERAPDLFNKCVRLIHPREGDGISRSLVVELEELLIEITGDKRMFNN